MSRLIDAWMCEYIDRRRKYGWMRNEDTLSEIMALVYVLVQPKNVDAAA